MTDNPSRLRNYVTADSKRSRLSRKHSISLSTWTRAITDVPVRERCRCKKLVRSTARVPAAPRAGSCTDPQRRVGSSSTLLHLQWLR